MKERLIELAKQASVNVGFLSDGEETAVIASQEGDNQWGFVSYLSVMEDLLKVHGGEFVVKMMQYAAQNHSPL